MYNKPLIYRDFNIELTDLEDNGIFKVRVIGQTPGGEMRSDETENATYNPSEFSSLITKLEKRKGSPKDILFKLGEKLSNLLLPGRVRTLYQQSLLRLSEEEGLRLRLRVEPLQLAALPWEYTYLQVTSGEKVASDFLAWQRRISIVHYETIGESLKPLEEKEKVHIAIVLATPTDQPDLDVEPDKKAIAAAIDSVNSEVQVFESTLVESATRDKLLESIKGTDIFHFSGHGVFEGTEFTQEGKILRKGKIILENADNESDPYDSQLLANNLGNAGVRLVILGACNSAARDEGGAWTGLAPSLVRENIPAVLAMQYKVRDKNAARFMAIFYARILGGYSIDEAIFEGRQAIFSNSGLEERDWGVPVVYLRAEDGIIFPVPKENETEKKQKSSVVNLQQRIREVRGENIGAKINTMMSGEINIEQIIDIVTGQNEGLNIDTITSDDIKIKQSVNTIDSGENKALKVKDL